MMRCKRAGRGNGARIVNADAPRQFPLSRVKQTSLPHRKMSAYDPKRTSMPHPWAPLFLLVLRPTARDIHSPKAAANVPINEHFCAALAHVFVMRAAHAPMKPVYTQLPYQSCDLRSAVCSSASELSPKVLGRS